MTLLDAGLIGFAIGWFGGAAVAAGLYMWFGAVRLVVLNWDGAVRRARDRQGKS